MNVVWLYYMAVLWTIGYLVILEIYFHLALMSSPLIMKSCLELNIYLGGNHPYIFLQSLIYVNVSLKLSREYRVLWKSLLLLSETVSTCWLFSTYVLRLLTLLPSSLVGNLPIFTSHMRGGIYKVVPYPHRILNRPSCLWIVVWGDDVAYPHPWLLETL